MMKKMKCGIEGCPKEYSGEYAPQSMAAHKYQAHGVRGKSKDAIRKRKKRAEQKKVEKNGSEEARRELYRAMVTVMLENSYPDGIPVGEIERVVTWMDETRGMLGV